MKEIVTKNGKPVLEYELCIDEGLYTLYKKIGPEFWIVPIDHWHSDSKDEAIYGCIVERELTQENDDG